MMKRFLTIALALLLPMALWAQEQDESSKTPEQKEREFYENIEKEVDRLADGLKLSDAQIFYVDSILTHNARALRSEVEALSQNKALSSEPYVYLHDKWMEENDRALRKVFSDEQWERYLKIGAAKARKAREKRAAKRNRKI